jgi:hypothetical protein
LNISKRSETEGKGEERTDPKGGGRGVTLSLPGGLLRESSLGLFSDGLSLLGSLSLG